MGKEGELEAVARVLCAADQTKGDGRGEGFQFFSDAFAADTDKHVAHPVVEVGEGEEAEWALGFKVVLDASADVVDKGEIVAIGSGSRAAQGDIEPVGVVLDHLMSADLDGRTCADEGDHEK